MGRKVFQAVVWPPYKVAQSISTPCPCTKADGEDLNSPSLCLTFSCRRTRSIKNFQQVSLESTSPWPLTSFLTLLMMFSTSSSEKRSGISPKRRGHVLVYWPGFCCSLRAKWSGFLPLPWEKSLSQVPTGPSSSKVAQKVILLKNKHLWEQTFL